MKIHPLAELFPMLEGPGYEAFKEDIRAKGQFFPVTLYEGQILDGRNRARACEELGIAIKTAQYEGTDPLGFVISANDHRRHLTEGQKGIIAAELANMKRGRPASQRDNVQICTSSISLDEAAKALGTSRRNAASGRKVLREAPEEIIQQVKSGKLTINAAIGKIDPRNQLKVAADNSKKIQQIALETGLSVLAHEKEIRGAAFEATGETCLRNIDMEDPAEEAKVRAAIDKVAGKHLDERYEEHRHEVKEIGETAKQKFDRLVQREVSLMREMFDREVQQRAESLLPSLKEQERKWDDEMRKYAAMRKGIKAQISEEDFKFLLNVLHPDRAPEDRREKFNRAFDIVKKLQPYVDACKAA